MKDPDSFKLRFITTTRQSDPVSRIGTFSLAVEAACAFSLSIGTTGSHVPYENLVELRATYMPASPELLDDLSRGCSGSIRQQGLLFWEVCAGGDNVVVFVSVWKDLDAVKERYGDDWQSSYLPAGYEGLIEQSSIRHFDVGSGWHVEGL